VEVDERAEFEQVAVANAPAMLRWAYLLSGDHGLAEDLVQESLLKVFRRWKRSGTPRNPPAYLRQVIVNEYLSWRRLRSNSEVVGPPLEGAQPDHAEAWIERDLVWRAMSRLPRRQRAVLVLRYYEDLTDADIATTLGCAEGTVRSLASRAFLTLRAEPQLDRYDHSVGNRLETP
jgi:RNA polymerase sigma-70 factor (sigma-E family)